MHFHAPLNQLWCIVCSAVVNQFVRQQTAPFKCGLLNLSSYSIDTKLPSNCSLDTWQSLGCLQSLTNLTLTGSLPGLPDSWSHDGSFPALQTMNFSLSGLTGSLPDSWAQASAFPALQTMNFSVTSLTGTLPSSWAGSSALPNLTALYLHQTHITGHSLSLCFASTEPLCFLQAASSWHTRS